MPVGDTISPPLVFDPLSGVHKYTVILLHGRGKTANDFAEGVLGTIIRKAPNLDEDSDLAPTEEEPFTPPQPPKSFQQCLPDSRFVFPSARKQRATVYKRSIVRQWFDDWHLGPEQATDAVDSRYDEGLQTSGLGETVARIHDLVAREAALVGGARNVALGGISQGAAASLTAALLWQGEEALGGVVGMCAWLPYRAQIMNVHSTGACHDDRGGEKLCIDADDGMDDFDPFDRPSNPQREETVRGALEWLREEIELPSTRPGWEDRAKDPPPVMLCHGLEDMKVEPERSQEAAKVMPGLGMGPVLRKTYLGVGHDFSDEMLSDVFGFLRQVCGRRAE